MSLYIYICSTRLGSHTAGIPFCYPWSWSLLSSLGFMFTVWFVTFIQCCKLVLRICNFVVDFSIYFEPIIASCHCNLNNLVFIAANNLLFASLINFLDEPYKPTSFSSSVFTCDDNCSSKTSFSFYSRVWIYSECDFCAAKIVTMAASTLVAPLEQFYP